MLVLLFTLLSSFQALAGPEFDLFTPEGSPLYLHDNYYDQLMVYEDAEAQDKLRYVKKGDVLKLPNGETAEYVEFLGSGQNTAVIEVADHRALRLMQEVHKKSVYFFKEYQVVYKELVKFIPEKRIVKVFPNEQPLPSHYFVEKLKIEQTLEEYFGEKIISSEEAKFKDLIEFVKDFEKVAVLDDFYTFQLGWIKKRGWVLFDWGDFVEIEERSKKPLYKEWLKIWIKESRGRHANFNLLKETLKSVYRGRALVHPNRMYCKRLL